MDNRPIVLARKPITEKTITDNVLRYGTGGLNIDACRIGDELIQTDGRGSNWQYKSRNGLEQIKQTPHEGRFPANFIIECTCEEVIPGDKGGVRIGKVGKDCDNGIYEGAGWKKDIEGKWFNDKGDIHLNPQCPCCVLDKQSGISDGKIGMTQLSSPNNIYNSFNSKNNTTINDGIKDTGGASRFFKNIKYDE